MKKTGIAPALLVLLASLGGCFTFEIEGDGDMEPGSHHRIVHGSWYGYAWNGLTEWTTEPVVEACSDGRGIYRAEYQTNGLYILATLATLGLYAPHSIEWWCQAPPEEPVCELCECDDEDDCACECAGEDDGDTVGNIDG